MAKDVESPGSLYAIVFVSDSHADEKARDAAIARITRFAFDTYSK